MNKLLATIDSADQPVLERAREIHAREGGVVTSHVVREINNRFGTDMATAVLYLHFESKLKEESTGAILNQPDTANDRPLLVAIAPGAFYKEHPEIGADGRDLIELSKQCSWECECIACESLGTLNQNAAVINEYLERKMRSHRLILVSLSKGASDARVARSLRPDLFDALQGWVSISGVVHGTRMANWLLDRWRLRPTLKMMLWYHQADEQALADLRYGPEQPLSAPFRETRFPLIHVAAFPLRRHLSCWRARLWHRRFRRRGPTDSVVMLEDLLRLPGIVIPVWGADHYMQSGWDVTGTAPRAYELARVFRTCGKTVVLGGPHVTLVPDDAQPHADSIVVGYAEDEWPKLLNDFASGQLRPRYTQSPNLDLSKRPLPNRSVLPERRFLTADVFEATRGCVHNCSFCVVPAAWGRKPLQKPVDEIVADIRSRRAKRAIFIDLNLIADRDYASELFETLIPLGIQWYGLATTLLCEDVPLLDLAARSGCRGLLMGLESIRPRFAIVTPFPGTAFYQHLESEDRILTREWELYDGQHAVFQPQQMSAETLRRGNEQAWRYAYRWRSIAWRLRHTGAPLHVALTTNLGYRYYANHLDRFYTCDWMLGPEPTRRQDSGPTTHGDLVAIGSSDDD